MAFPKYELRSALDLLTVLVLLSPLASPWMLHQAETVPTATLHEERTPPPERDRFEDWTNLLRTSVTLPNSSSLSRLDSLGVVVLEETETHALILADAMQLEKLARLRFRPRASDDLGMLVHYHADTNPRLLDSLQPLLAKARDVRARSLDTHGRVGPMNSLASHQAQIEMRSAMHSLTTQQQQDIMALNSIDSDGDGLTDTEEYWWCTDPLNPDSKDNGVSDGDAVAALMAWMYNELPGPPASGTPFKGWPMLPGDGQFNPECVDQDRDSVPDLAERWMLGLSPNRESTSRDKFDDGQKLFGITAWNWGALPRAEDTGVIFAEMPAWVSQPGNHPLVAAYPVPEIDVVESSLRVETVTVVTTDETITEGEERSYSTAKTHGTTTSVADSVIWNEWEETSVTSPETQVRLNHHQSHSMNMYNYQSTHVTVQQPPPPANLLGTIDTLLGLPGKAAQTGRQIGEGINQITYVGSRVYNDLASGRKLQWPVNYFDEYQEIERNLQNRCVGACGAGVMPAHYYDALAFQDYEGQNHVTGRAGRTASAGDGVVTQSFYPMSYPVSVQVPSTTETSGRLWGGEQTTTNSQYEEHTVTNGEAFFSSESWSTATAVNSAHAADLWFTYRVRNSGMEYAREIANLAFNIYIGDDVNPAITYFVAPDLGGDGKFHNFMPGEEHTYTSRRIPLSLEQMRALDLAGPVRIEVEDFSYGVDELFYQDAINSGVLIAIDDGPDDGNEAIDTYVIPTWGSETVMDVLARYFPHTLDAYSNLVAIWAPNYRADTPAWCDEPRVVGTGAQRTLWCRKALSTADWWNIYTRGMGDGSEGFQDTLASPGSVALFRFNKDSDLDGYSDRAELRLGTDPHDPTSYPRPELLAGVHSVREGDRVTATLSLLNTGLYDAYGVEAIMIAPNDTISITYNTVGGSGRVRAQREVVVGSRIRMQAPLPAPWTQSGHAQPATGGYYTGQQDRTYTFTVQCGVPSGCDVSAGAWALAWNDGAGASGTLDFSAGYASPTLLPVGAYGLKLGLLSGRVVNGESFTVEARTPRDTFQYAINAEPFTPPVVVVSYNDPQGNHRFIIPPEAMALSSPTDDLVPFAGQMLKDPGVELVTTEAAAEGSNTTNLVVNNPTGVTLSNAHLFLNFMDLTGTVASEVVVTTTLPAGPSVVPVAWDTGAFSPAYQVDEDYIVLAFLTDWQGNILDTAGRPLSSFQPDPKPAFAMDPTATVWDFDEAAQGTVLKRAFDLANTGYLDLLTYVNAPPGITLSQHGSRSVTPADVTTYEITVDTSSLPLGPYSEILTLRSSDPDSASQTVQISGTISEGAPDTPAGVLQRPLDWPVTLTSGTQGQWVQFTHTLGPNTETLHPVSVYDEGYATLWGVGKYATPFGSGTASYDMFGDGRDGNRVVGNGEVAFIDNDRVVLSGSASAGQTMINFTTGNGNIFQKKDQHPRQQWTSTGFRIAAGERLRVTPDTRGHPDLHKVCYGGSAGCHGPSGISETAPTGWTAPGIRKYSLVGRIGNGPPFFIGSNFDSTVNRSGELYLGLNDCNGCFGDNSVANGSVGFGFNIWVYHTSSQNLQVGDRILVMQMTGSGAGRYEVATIAGRGSNSIQLVEPLQNSYLTSGSSRAQILRVPQYQSLTVRTGGELTCRQWDGVSGGVCGFSANEEVIVESGGRITAARSGFSGGTATPWSDSAPGYQGASYTGASPLRSRSANGGGGGGGQNNGGGGGGYGTRGSDGQRDWTSAEVGYGGNTYGTSDLTTIFLGSGGGGTSHAYGDVARGGYGGGILVLVAKSLTVAGTIDANGQGGGQPGYTNNYAPEAPLGGGRAGGGGSGGSVLVVTARASIGSNRVTAMGGARGNSTDGKGRGGAGGVGRIRLEYCETLSGTANPAASTQKLDCYIAEQVETSPYTSGRLNLPETFANGRTYQVQYGRRHVFSSAGEQASVLRVPAAAFTDVRLDALISGVGTGTRTVRFDIGNDGTWDWEWTGSVNESIALNSANLSAAFSRYWASQGAPTSGTLDVPVRVYLSRGGQVLLTNLRVTPTGSKVRYARLAAQTYANVALNLRIGTSGAGPLTVAADVGDNGTVDWTYSTAGAAYPLALATDNLAAAFNPYLDGHTGEVIVPVRFYVTPDVALRLTDFNAAAAAKPDLSLAAGDIAFGATAPTETDVVPITITLHNHGGLAATGHTAAFYAMAPEWGDWYIGSAFVPGIAAGGTAQASILWDTRGFTGEIPVRVVADPYNRLPETNEENNQATASLTILTRPDLQPAFVEFSNPEPVAGETITVSLQVENLGQAAAGAFDVDLYDGDPAEDGSLLQTVDLTVPGEGEMVVPFTWTPSQPGLHRLFAQVDKEGVVNESNRGNNLAWHDIYVGFAGPLLLDSGGASDPGHSAALGYGVLDEGPADVIGACGALPHETYRLDPAGRVIYRFDHLLPGHFYHLDVTMYECDGASRQQTIRVNGHPVAGPIDLGDGHVHRLSLLLDPALYTGHTIRVEIGADGVDGAIVNEVNLHNIDYRYADAGGPRDPQYPGGATAALGRPYGWLNGVHNTAWGTLPYQSVRVNQTGNLLQYRFDGLQPEKRYNVHLTFWQPSGAGRIQRVQLDGLDTGLTVNTGDYQPHRETVAVPPTAYADDGSVIVGVLRINADSGAIINEIALEEETLPRTIGCDVEQTPYFTDVYGDVTILSEGAPAGTVIEALNPRGETVGCFVVSAAGQYGFMRIYGEDTTATPPIPGMRAGELTAFRVSGAPAVAAPLLYWQADFAPHRVDLNAGSITGQSVLLNAGWNLMSFRPEPAVPTLRQVLDSIDGRYDRVLGETGVHAPSVPDVYNTLKELQPGQGYYVRITGSTAASALIEGLTVPVTTPLTLHTGWNWIGYLPEGTLPITQALQSIDGEYQRVLSLDKTYDPSLPEYSTLRFMEPGRGYLIHANQAVTLTYPAGGAMASAESQGVTSAACAGLAPTPTFMLLYGELWLGSQPAPAGSLLEVLTPRGDIAGCFELERPGVIGLMHVYGEDTTATPPIGGFRDGEPLAFRVNGVRTEGEELYWSDNWSPHAVALSAELTRVYLPIVIRGR